MCRLKVITSCPGRWKAKDTTPKRPTRHTDTLTHRCHQRNVQRLRTSSCTYRSLHFYNDKLKRLDGIYAKKQLLHRYRSFLSLLAQVINGIYMSVDFPYFKVSDDSAAMPCHALPCHADEKKEVHLNVFISTEKKEMKCFQVYCVEASPLSPFFSFKRRASSSLWLWIARMKGVWDSSLLLALTLFHCKVIQSAVCWAASRVPNRKKRRSGEAKTTIGVKQYASCATSWTAWLFIVCLCLYCTRSRRAIHSFLPR